MPIDTGGIKVTTDEYVPPELPSVVADIVTVCWTAMADGAV
jgi:hypothetical protein